MTKHQKVLVLLMLLFTASQSWVRLMVVPLWAHYDEPTHYEYVRFIVENFRLPHPGDADLDILSRIAANSGGQFGPCADKPAGAGPCFEPGRQFAEAPGYYVLQAVFQWLFAPGTLQQQVWLARLVSALLALAVAWLAFLTVRQVLPNDFLLAISVPAAMAAIIGYIDLMSALNNDVGATAAMSFLFFAGVKAIRQGVRATSAGLVFVAVGLCLASKASAFIGLPLGVAGLWLAAWPRLPKWLKVGAPLMGAVAGLMCFDLNSPAGWMRQYAAGRSGRVQTSTPLGQYAFHIEHESQKSPAMWQAIPAEAQAALRGRTVTVGAWVRTLGGSMQVPLPVIGDGQDFLKGRDVPATPDWAFYSYSVEIPDNIRAVAVFLPGAAEGPVEYDGVLLITGAPPSDTRPKFDGEGARQGTWGDAAFDNLVTLS